MILFLKTLDGSHEKLPLRDKLIMIFKDRVKDADDDEGRARAQRDLAKMQATPAET
ncbi:hypothetical protein [Tardiphaga sp. 709]|uniref:hypothetical protein n=1 Tax=Tardiphaga sp. 709 TaxID=3076039 RepID=UPI0028E67D8C|nr:hypothetical protein [Tardiphaga sp. 709]WNV10724.1 hypothetical protein RSO67_05920 [Tardiphaga sp. 709]